MTNDSIFQSAFEVIEKIEQAGGEAYVVGGSVRDFLSGRQVGDIDIATSEPPERIQEIFDKVIPVGIEHGTVIVRHHSESYEVTTYRTETGYEDYRHPDEVTFVRDICEDLSRRDFTMNAIAMDRFGALVDPYGGQTAIENQVIEAVGDPSTRFREDPLRMMRALRFSSQLLFTIEERTGEALVREAPLLAHISIERLAVETLKLYAGEGYKQALKLLVETCIIEQLPILNQLEIVKKAPMVRLQSWPELITYYLDLHPHLTIAGWRKTWKLSKHISRSAEFLSDALQKYQKHQKVTPWLVYQLPNHLYGPFTRVLNATGETGTHYPSVIDHLNDQLPIHVLKDLAFQAKDLIDLYPDQKKGPWISHTMETIEYKVVEGMLENDYEMIKEWVIQWNPPVNN